MKEFQLKYGCNPHQKPARIYVDSGELPIKILNGRPGYINLMDALNSWQAVAELDQITNRASAASFKHVSPTSVAISAPMSEELKMASFVDDIDGLDSSDVALAYAAARGVDRLSSYGDFAAVSRTCDAILASILRREVSDGIIAPGFTDDALDILRQKKKGNYIILQIDPEYIPDEIERKQIFGITFEQKRNDALITSEKLKNIVTKNRDLPDSALTDLIVASTALKYTQSNSVAYAKGGRAIGIGAGQQSRVHCTRLAGSKADLWHLRQSEKVLSLPFKDDVSRPARDNAIDLYLGPNGYALSSAGGWEDLFTKRPEPFSFEEKRKYLDGIDEVSLSSDAFFPFGDNIERANESGVKFVAQPGGSIRDDQVIDTCNRYGMVMAFTGIRLFHH